MDQLGERTRRPGFGRGCWGIPGAVPLGLRKNAKGGENGTQLASLKQVSHFLQRIFPRAKRKPCPRNHAPGSEVRPALCVGWSWIFRFALCVGWSWGLRSARSWIEGGLPDWSCEVDGVRFPDWSCALDGAVGPRSVRSWIGAGESF